MAAPVVVQASNGLALASGDGVVSLPGTTLGNLIVLHVLSKAASGDYGADTFTQLENLSAVGGTMELSGINAPVGSGKDIVLENGTYDNASPFNNTGGHRIYART